MISLRAHKLLARYVLAWFVVVVGLSVVLPVAQPGSMDAVCSASAGPMSSDSGDTDHAQVHSGLHCPLCVAIVPPYALARSIGSLQATSGLALQLVEVVRAVPTAVPPPSRGPPLVLV